MSGLSNAEHQSVLGHYFSTTALPAVAAGALKVHLHTADPGAAGADNEVDGAAWTNYAAADVHRDGVTEPYWSGVKTGAGPGERYVDNVQIVDFGEAAVPGDAVSVTHFSVKDSAGRFIGATLLDSPQTVNDGNPVRFDPEALVVALERSE